MGNLTVVDADEPEGQDLDAIAVMALELPNGRSPFLTWLKSIKDSTTQVRIQNRLARVRVGNLGDTKPVGGEVFELRLDFGPGYRIYFAKVGETIVVLLAGGDKSTQQTDIERAIELWKGNKVNAERHLRSL